MDAKQYEKLKDTLCHELEQLNQRGSVNQADIDRIYKLTTSIKNIQKIEMMEDEGSSMYGGSSYRMSRDGRESYGRNGSYGGTRGLMTYERDGGASYRGRDAMGRYSRDGVERENLMLTKEIDIMLNNNNLSDSERDTLRKALEIMRV